MASPVSADRVGVCSWSLEPESPRELVESLRACGIDRVQLALNRLTEKASQWRDTPAVLRDAGVTVISGMFGCRGEDYSTLDTIRETGGFMLDANWDANRRIAEEALAHAKTLGCSTVSTHVGFLPDDAAHPAYAKMIDRIGRVADHYASAAATLIFETGQETAATLDRFLADLNRPNVGVNFDPANMILYAKGDPVASLRRLLPRVRQVHIKDAISTKTPGTWGREVRAGTGEVDWPLFLGVLAENGYRGDLVIEREAGESRVEDIRAARALLLQGGATA